MFLSRMYACVIVVSIDQVVSTMYVMCECDGMVIVRTIGKVSKSVPHTGLTVGTVFVFGASSVISLPFRYMHLLQC